MNPFTAVTPKDRRLWLDAMPIGVAFGNWLAGIIDGEASFGIVWSHSHRTLICRFHMGMRFDERPILEEICRRTGLGSVVNWRSKGAKNPCSEWTIQRRDDAFWLCVLLDEFPLRAKKARDYEIWRRAVVDWHSTPRGNGCWSKDWSVMAACREELIAQRKAPPHPVEPQSKMRAIQ